MLRQGEGYRRLVAFVLLAGAALVPALALTRDAPTADAEAMVIMQRIDIDPAALPRSGEAVFNNGRVAQAVREQLGRADHEAIPEYVSVVTPEDGILFPVVGHSQDQQTAVDLANGAADAFVAALNAPGVGVGHSTVLEYAKTATTPASPAETLLPALALAAALAVAGLLLLRSAPALI